MQLVDGSHTEIDQCVFASGNYLQTKSNVSNGSGGPFHFGFDTRKGNTLFHMQMALKMEKIFKKYFINNFARILFLSFISPFLKPVNINPSSTPNSEQKPR